MAIEVTLVKRLVRASFTNLVAQIRMKLVLQDERDEVPEKKEEFSGRRRTIQTDKRSCTAQVSSL